jgi:phosphoribosyl-ATP pyrophosphohydrolase
MNKMSKNQLSFEELFSIIRKKISNEEGGSYTYELAKLGIEKISRKIGEEALEVVIASFVNERKNDIKSHQDLVGEICDLFFHVLVLMAHKNIKIEEIFHELTCRNNKKND